MQILSSRFSEGRVTIAAPIPAPLVEINYCAAVIRISRTHFLLKQEDYALRPKLCKTSSVHVPIQQGHMHNSAHHNHFNLDFEF